MELELNDDTPSHRKAMKLWVMYYLTKSLAFLRDATHMPAPVVTGDMTARPQQA
jgi:hypothetical protein